MKTKTLDDLPNGFKFKIDSDIGDMTYVKLDRSTTPSGDEFYDIGEILAASIDTGEVFKIEKETKLSYFYRDYVK